MVDWVGDIIVKLGGMDNVMFLFCMIVFGYFVYNYIVFVEWVIEYFSDFDLRLLCEWLW